MFFSDLLSGLVITFVAVFSWLGLLQIWHIYVASIIFGFVEVFFFPAYQAVIPQITRPDLLTSGNGNRTEILASLYGVEVAKQMLEVLAEEEGLSLTGFISPISLTRSNRREIAFFVNGRPVQDAALGTALVQAYHTLLMVGRYPLAILFLQLPAEAVDVNVHPTKAEVRFKNADLVFRGVQRAVRRALLS